MNAITGQAQLTYNNGAGLFAQMPPTQFNTANVAVSGSNYEQNTMSVPTAAGGTAIPIGNLANLGLCCIQNLDLTNYVTLLTAVSGTVIMKLMPGDPPFLFRFGSGITAPALLSHTGVCQVQYLIIEN